MRVVQLDVLRAIAVLLVLGRHLPFVNGEISGISGSILDYWQKIGWIGVDLFFVLSGFLVSGLLFREHQRYGQISIKRFLIRRGFKIYPAFYFFLIVCLPLASFLDNNCTWRNYLSEALFVQNYFEGILGHTWSLAVEEHFYLLLATVFGILAVSRRPDPFKKLPLLFAGIAIFVLSARIVNSLLIPYSFRTHMEQTHLRIDSLLFGVLLAYWYHFRPNYIHFCKNHPFCSVSVSALFLLPVLGLDISNFFCHTVGLSCAYFAFGVILLVAVTSEPPSGYFIRSLSRLLAVIGAGSYSIYLWHIPVRKGVLCIANLLFPDGGHEFSIFVCYVVASVVFGMIMAKCLERPTMALRDRLFPSRLATGSNPCSSPAAASQPSDTAYVFRSNTGGLLWNATSK